MEPYKQQPPEPPPLPRALWVTIVGLILATQGGMSAFTWMADEHGGIYDIAFGFAHPAIVLIAYLYYRNTGNAPKAIGICLGLFILLTIFVLIVHFVF